MGDRTRLFKDGERGAAAVEMALTSILLLLLFAGTVDLGRVLYARIGLQEAAQEGAIFASFSIQGEYDNSVHDPLIEARILDSVDFPELDGNLITVTTDCSQTPTEVAITVEHPVDLITPIVGDFLGGQITLSQTIRAQAFLAECP